MEDHPTLFTKCERYGSQVTPCFLGNWHYESDKLRLGEELQSRKTNLQYCFKASRFLINVKSEPLEPVAEFTYLGRTVA